MIVMAAGYPYVQSSSGITLKFMPQMPAKAEQTAKIAAQAANLLFTSLSSIATIERFT